ncbi:nitronate monooxygenase [Palleronia marisminoris]|uniref:Propionate 3-nitronate monooxygenase n=2 Tax=Palleronia marisminoris TaxID=315423 RepID=A0A1Y5SED9_9RHOB|nr:nitronate monooxygenase [Palleronia marisminoris]SLN38694.1 Nitronate monooxygenase [Palleronia marisminoris]
MLDRALRRVDEFCTAYDMRVPILMAPMAGACPPALAAAVAEAGGMGGCGALMMDPDEIAQWAAEFRAASKGPFQMNLWVPDPAPPRDADHERAVTEFLAAWGPAPARLSADLPVPFADQCEALIEARPAVMSSIMGLFPPHVVDRMKAGGISWFATATTVAEALQAEAAGADAIIAQGSEAGGHRGAFNADKANAQMCGSMALVPAIHDAVGVPVIAAGGMADARGVVAALALGASAVLVGTAFLRAPEAAIAPAWADAIGRAQPDDTTTTRAFSGRLGRSLRTDYIAATECEGAPAPLPYPLQRSATGPMRALGAKENNLACMQAWAGQSARLARNEPAGEIVRSIWTEARATLIQ